jgi:hypothetical protein
MKLIFSLFIFFLTTSYGTIVCAEYRVFNLKISKPSPEKGQPAIERFVLSTLDPNQYRDYNPVDSTEQITYTDTWRCYGRTDWYQEYCPKPAKPHGQRQPAQATPPPGSP